MITLRLLRRRPTGQIGQYAEVERSFSPEEVKLFGSLVKDQNFLHESVPWSDDIETMQASFPITKAHISEGLVIRDQKSDTEMTRPLVQGILLSSMFSSIFAGLVPGCVYINQTLSFASPVFANELVKSRVTIEKLRRWPKGGIVVQCETQIQKAEDETIAIKGTANVWLPQGHRKAN
ncbi:unnamed protein product [Cylindrotheca closterium]|uniref:MaoC-like domain-containing protein n=1 Tax=Cylindrotheca closterium TaxID=2856 RepID=A0AAD2CK94_9STRA|nr:unnamed protein product [Cylindrotheca closterium]